MFYNQSGPITSAAFVASILNSNVKYVKNWNCFNEFNINLLIKLNSQTN